jgi:hypothetical protein
MRRFFTSLVILAAFAGTISAQAPAQAPIPQPTLQPFSRLNSIQLDLLGHGGIYSLNYERVQFNGPRFKTVLRAGAGIYPAWQGDSGIRFKIPVTIHQLLTIAGGHHAELGAGFVFTNEYNFITLPFAARLQGVEEYAAFHLGYRYQHPNRRLILKAGFTPFLGTFHKEVKPDFIPSAVYTVGYAF